jgi:chromosome segregation ATPase
MKINPLADGARPEVNLDQGHSAGADRIARAKAVAAGQSADTATPQTGDPQVDRIQNQRLKIKLRTQQSTNRPPEIVDPAIDPVATEVSTEKVATEVKADIIPVETQATEATKPLSPQIAALAKQRRELQLERQKLDAEKKALEDQKQGTSSLESYKARIKAEALKVLQEEGVTYDQLTEQILASNQENAELSTLKQEIKALKEGLENQNKSITDREAQTEQQVLAQLNRDVSSLISQGDDFEMVREAGYAPKVVDLIHKTFKTTGEYLDVSEAASLIEKELLEDSLRFAKLSKVQSALKQPAQTPVQQPRGPIRTLTNRDGTSSVAMSKRDRAIAVMEGRLK